MTHNEIQKKLMEPFCYSDEFVNEAREIVAKWDAGDLIPCVTLGGIGPGYEQAIVIAIVEFARVIADDKPETWSQVEEIARQVIRDRLHGYGYSGAQVGAAQSFAVRAVVCGWTNVISAFGDNREIIASRHFPVAPDAPKPVGQEAA